MGRYDFTRRTLLGWSAAAAGALTGAAASSAALAASDKPVAKGQPYPSGVPLPSSPPPAPKGDSLGVAIIGLGRYALAQIMPSFAAAKGCHIAAVVSGNAEKAGRVAKAYGLAEDSIYSYDDFDRIASDDRIGAVYVILPSGLHADWTEKAFAAGKHVMCEKPMALSAAECERMIAASERAGRKLMIGYRCHFEPYNLKAMELMREEALGSLRLIRTAHQYPAGPTTPAENWRFNRALAGGGPLEDYGLYGLQAALYLTGEMPDRVAASSLQPKNDPRFTEIVAHTSTQLHFPSGVVAQLGTSYDSYPINAVSARGSRGALEMQPATGYGGNVMTLLKDRTEEELTPGDSGVQFSRMLSHFADAVRTGGAILTPGEMGLRDVRLMEAIYQAAASGRTLALNPDGTVRA
jgi:glucose-fructose oxidoreductase